MLDAYKYVNVISRRQVMCIVSQQNYRLPQLLFLAIAVNEHMGGYLLTFAACPTTALLVL